MKISNYILIPILFLTIAISCKNEEDEPTNPTASSISKSDLIGTWNLVEAYSETNGVRTAISLEASALNGQRITKMQFSNYYVTQTVSYPYNGSITTYDAAQMYSIGDDGYLIIPDADDIDGYLNLINGKLEFKQVVVDDAPVTIQTRIFVYSKI